MTEMDVKKFSENVRKLKRFIKDPSKLELRPCKSYNISKEVPLEELERRAYIQTKPDVILAQLQFKLYELESQETKNTIDIDIIKYRIEEVKQYLPLFGPKLGFDNYSSSETKSEETDSEYDSELEEFHDEQKENDNYHDDEEFYQLNDEDYDGDWKTV
jgi:hypothetical protein